MVTLNLIDTATITQILLLVLALGLSFLALRAGAFVWFVVAFVWLGLAATVTTQWMGLGACLMACVSIALFVLTTGGSKQRR